MDCISDGNKTTTNNSISDANIKLEQPDETVLSPYNLDVHSCLYEPLVSITEGNTSKDPWPVDKSEAESDDCDNDPDFDVKKVTSKSPRKVRGKRGRRKKISEVSVYKNPFVYTNMRSAVKERKNNLQEYSNVKWSCMICNQVCTDKSSLIDHYEFHKNLREEQESKGIIVTQEDNDYFKCGICSKEFTSLRSYHKHNERFHGDRAHACEICNKSYKSMMLLCIHNYTTHETEKMYRCIVCDFKTELRKSLRQHLNIHEESYKYKCEICGKGFSSITWFEEHKNFHTGAMPFECEICTKTFPYTRYLVAHKKSMHPEIYSDTPVVNSCPICNKKFAHKKSLIMHIRGHNGENTVLCDMCGKRLSSSEHLKQHIRIHTGFKPYNCQVCGKSFAKKCNLTLHERVHSGEKPYICRTCGKSFSQRSTLVIHERYHSGERPYVCHMCHKGFVAKGLLSVHLKTCSRFLPD